MTTRIPDLNDRALFPPFAALPVEGASDAGSDSATTDSASAPYLLAQIKDDMTINKPTLVLADRDGHPFALVFDGLDRDGLDLGRLGLKKGATCVVRNAHQSVPAATSGDDSLTGRAARRPFVSIAPGQAHTVQAIPGKLEQAVAAADSLRRRQGMADDDDASKKCDACGDAAAKLLKCTGCGQAQYCNRTNGWSGGHRGECKAWRALTAIWP